MRYKYHTYMTTTGRHTLRVKRILIALCCLYRSIYSLAQEGNTGYQFLHITMQPLVEPTSALWKMMPA